MRTTRKAATIRQALTVMLAENEVKQKNRHQWEWFVQWLNGDDDAPVPRAVKALIDDGGTTR